MKPLQKLNFRSRKFISSFTILFVITIGLIFTLWPKSFEASSYLIINEQKYFENVMSDYWNILGLDNTPLTVAELTIDEFVELQSTDSFIRLIVSKTDLEPSMGLGDKIVRETIFEVRDSIKLSRVADEKIEIRATWTDKKIASQLANATLESFVSWRLTSDLRDLSEAREFLEQLVPQYEQEYKEAAANLDRYLSEHPEPISGERPISELKEIKHLMLAIKVANERFKGAFENWEKIHQEHQETTKKMEEVYQPIYVTADALSD